MVLVQIDLGAAAAAQFFGAKIKTRSTPKAGLWVATAAVKEKTREPGTGKVLARLSVK